MVAAVVGLAGISLGAAEPFEVVPGKADLVGHFARAQLVVSRLDGRGQRTGSSEDLTARVHYLSLDSEIVRVSDSGRLLAVSDGQTSVAVTHEDTTRYVEVTVSGTAAEPSIGFREQISPILSKHGCNQGACHASQHGKGGFKLSVFGFDPGNDRSAIVRQRHQRRVNFVRPRETLLLRKPSLQVPHGGGRRLETDSVDHDILLAWITAGAPGGGKSPQVTGLEVFPTRRVGPAGITQQLRVVARYSDRTSRDVTAWAKYDSMDESLLDVSAGGQVTAIDRGQAPVMVRYEGQSQIAMFVIPYAEPVTLAGWSNNNFVDEPRPNSAN